MVYTTVKISNKYSFSILAHLTLDRELSLKLRLRLQAIQLCPSPTQQDTFIYYFVYEPFEKVKTLYNSDINTMYRSA